MSDQAILFFTILMSLIFVYRIVLSVLFLSKKKYLLDEKFYITIFYSSLVGILVLFTDWFIAGYILMGILPFVLTLYISLSPKRIYWIVNGFSLTEATFVNEIIKEIPNYENSVYRLDKIHFIKKKSESKIKIEFTHMQYEEKERILKIIKNVLKEKTKKSNKREISTILLYFLLTLFMIFLIILTLFT